MPLSSKRFSNYTNCSSARIVTKLLSQRPLKPGFISTIVRHFSLRINSGAPSALIQCEPESLFKLTSMQSACATLPSVASLAPPHLSALSHKRHDFWRKVTEHKMCTLIFSTTFVRNIFHFTNNSERFCHKCENVFT